MFMKLTRAWVSADEYVYVEIYGDRGIETRYSLPDNKNKKFEIRYFDNAHDAFCAMEQWHEDGNYEEI